MAAIQFFTNLNLNRNEIQNAVIENTTENDIQNPVIGQLIFDTDIASLKYYDGETWQISKARMPGLLVYKGMIRHDVGSEPSDPKTGDLYVFSSGGMTNGFGAVEVQIGDFLLYDGTETGWAWTVIQGNVGVVGCHPESQAHWYASYSWMQGLYHNGHHHKLLLDFVDELMTL